MYDELGWETVSDRRWARRLTIFYKISCGLAPPYLSEHFPQRNDISINLRNRADVTPFIRTDRYENSFYPFTIKAWKNLDDEAKSKPSVQSFKKHLNNFIRPQGHSFFGLRDNYGTKLLTKIRVTFSDLRDHRFNQLAQFVRVVLKMKHLFTFSYAIRSTSTNVPFFLAKYQQLLIPM